MRIAYLVNQYPKVSHTFIRREIAALEARGVQVSRYSLRRVAEPLADPANRRERGRTRVILEAGAGGIAASMAAWSARRPVAFARASALAAKIGLGSERGLAIHGAYLGEACVLADRLREEGIDHVHAHFGTNPAAVAMLAGALSDVGYSFQVHGPEELDKPQAIALATKIERARFVGAISSFCRSQLYRWVGYTHWPKIHVVRCGVDPTFLEGDGRPFPSGARLVSVGRLSEQKGQMLLIEALAQLAREGVDFHLTLVGDGELRPALEEAIARLGLARRVTITGWASGEAVREHILGARALVLPSFAEGLPVVIMEAFGLGRPVLSTYVAGIPELVEPGRSGWLIPAGSVDALVSGLREVLATPVESLEAMGRAGRDAVRQRHDVRQTAATLHDLLVRYAGISEHDAIPSRAPVGRRVRSIAR